MTFHENVFFRQVTLRIGSSLNFETAMQRLMDYLRDYVPLTGFMLLIYDPNLPQIRVMMSVGDGILSERKTAQELPEEFRAELNEWWGKANQILISNDVSQGTPIQGKICEYLFGTQDVSLVSLFLEQENQRIGVFMPYKMGRNQYRRHHIQKFSLIHDPLVIAMINIIQHHEILKLKDMLKDDNLFLQQQLHEMTGDRIIGADRGLREVMEKVYQVAPLNSPVMIMGETGTGKEVIANAIHYTSKRHQGPFIKVNCGAIPSSLMDSELFGHEKGAFTGATERRRGRFERADGGTIFLDEIGELTIPAQIRLLRVLQSGEFDRVGGSQLVKVNVRVISATHRDLLQMINNHRFREDLWYRLNVFPIDIPPLRRRKNDIPALLNHFIDRKCREMKIHTLPSIPPDLPEQLAEYHWPGNVREFENWVERALIRSRVNEMKILEMKPEHLSHKMPSADAPPPAPQNADLPTYAEYIHTLITTTLKTCRGKVEGQGGAAEILALHPSTLRAKMRKLNISPKAFKL